MVSSDDDMHDDDGADEERIRLDFDMTPWEQMDALENGTPWAWGEDPRQKLGLTPTGRTPIKVSSFRRPNQSQSRWQDDVYTEDVYEEASYGDDDDGDVSYDTSYGELQTQHLPPQMESVLLRLADALERLEEQAESSPRHHTQGLRGGSISDENDLCVQLNELVLAIKERRHPPRLGTRRQFNVMCHPKTSERFHKLQTLLNIKTKGQAFEHLVDIAAQAVMACSGGIVDGTDV